jgi:[ribosomal protein S5]-alanine N-acetyltransferase
MPPTLHSTRLTLRLPADSDLPAFLNAINLPSILETFLERDTPLSPDEALEMFEAAERRGSRGSGYEFIIVLNETSDLAGGVNIWIEQDDMKAEIAFWCTPKYQGQGIVSESLKLVYEWAFKTLEIERIFGACASDNKKSALTMERAGMTLEGTLRHDCHRGDGYVDSLLFGIIKDDWPA